MITAKKFRVIELTGGYVAVIDAEDFRRVNRYKWFVNKSKGSKKKLGQPYARTNINGKKVYMHRFIMGEEDPSVHVDHKNHCTLDNRKENLRSVTPKVNRSNQRKRPT